MVHFQPFFMVINFFSGMVYCRKNSERLSASGRIIINDSNGTDPYGLFLLNIAFEEMGKAIFCYFIHKGWVEFDFVKSIFTKHEHKIFILDEIIKSFSLENGVLFLGGKKMGEKTLDEFKKNYPSETKAFREDTMNYLYVKPDGDNWHVPAQSFKDLKEREEKITQRISEIHAVLEVILLNSDKSTLNNFKIVSSKKGVVSVQFDVI